jgi:branched-chain amino acid aminotransferase
MDAKQFELNTNGLNVDTCEKFRLPANRAFNWKTTNCLFYILAGLYMQNQHLDDCLLLNDKDHIAEASSSNVFVLRGNKLRTPPLRSGCKAGTMRKKIISLAPELGLDVVKKKTEEKHLFEADEVWLTNAIHGIRWVSKFREQAYQQEVASQMVNTLNKQLLH